MLFARYSDPRDVNSAHPNGIARHRTPGRLGTAVALRDAVRCSGLRAVGFGARVSAELSGVTVIIPVRNEAAYVRGAIESVQRAARGVTDVEIFIIDGMSDDDTAAIVASMAEDDPRIRLFENQQRTVPHAMNLGIRASVGDVIIRIDGHAEVEPDFIRNSVAELVAHPECACVGGPIENVSENQRARAISEAMSSTFGVGNARFRTGGRDGYVDTVAFGAYRKADLFAIGLYDEALTRNEDDDLNFRLIRSGRLIWFSNSIRSLYYVRSSYSKLHRQYYQYGYWKVYVNRKHGRITNLRQVVPPLFVGVIALLGVLVPILTHARVGLIGVLATYLFVAAVSAFRSGSAPRRALFTIAAFFTLHTGYGIGYWAGLCDFAVLHRQPAASATRLSR